MSFQITIETPGGSREKYIFDTASESFVLKKVLTAGMVFPFDFGFIPFTIGEDGNPLDAMVISELQFFPGCRVDCRLIGMLKAKETQGRKTIRNDRYFFIPGLSVLYGKVDSILDLTSVLLKELISFFVFYNREEGKQFKPIKMAQASEAQQILSTYYSPVK